MTIIRVTGEPKPKGSVTAMRTGNRTVYLNGSTKKGRELFNDWAYAVEFAAADVAKGQPYWPTVDPVEVNVDFRLHRGKTVRRIMHTTKPDIDKLARAILDPLTGIVWKDDAQVVILTATKRYVREGETSGATIYITTLGTEQ